MMSQTAISEELFCFLDGNSLKDKTREAMMLLSVSEDGWPHAAMVSVGEMVALNQEELRIALWPKTHTVANLKRTKQATLVAVHKGKVHYVRLAIKPLPALKDAKHNRERFQAKVVSVKEDTAKYAKITSGIRFALYDPESVVRRWTETVSELKK
ncbi:pyridoxamine 5'-phosphate oxidase family protein [Thermoactinomyces intermedius]|uniref:Pyridoxamine 5'-phosphate oxidase family protein n=1 Tax=Thermoactinomyces intermedius TaxID=2024 RepID=A0A8I1ADS8_THEIN|nr:pyridoxamine 5'-phosphate oxidase family protein [Thermoactinomyces intermedius]MBA4549071.1 pyridoxamine 5'-phosphate oxidase family protein [Thermoactinomyces intermedius]MBA4835504.1 pyridoxamine 5'-phosphate oxidase family protein [Thermoactinomyces intermedius]MBH8595479.1 pyridoxamine 5'-phosphate oxidase family protein [Thermoactinomyces intermedius]